MNICSFIGNFCHDPETRETQTGVSVCNFNLAVNGRPYKKSDGTKVKEVCFIACECWHTGAEVINKYFRKGDAILVHCSAREDRWTDKSGEKKSRMKFRVNQFEFLPGGIRHNRDEDEEENDDHDTAKVEERYSDDDEVPFA